MSFIEVKVDVECRCGLGFPAYFFTLLVLRVMARVGAAYFLRYVFLAYHRLIPGLAIAITGIRGPVVNNAQEAVRRTSAILKVLRFVAARLTLIRLAL